jgi:hypothetical protein
MRAEAAYQGLRKAIEVLAGALLQNESLEARSKRREVQGDEWSGWFRRRMDANGIADPVALLPDAFARLQFQMEDKVNSAIKDLKKSLQEALK